LYSPGAKSIPQVCQDELQVLRTTLDKYPHPTKWTYIIACDDNAWSQLERMVGVRESMSDVLGVTNYDGQSPITIFKGTVLLTSMESDHVVAHELAHIYLRSKDEFKVDALAQTWMASAQKAAIIAKKE
jgi:hypothetical protein